MGRDEGTGMEQVRQVFPGVYASGKRILTRNLAPGRRVYGEKLHASAQGELREWDPYRSKLAAALRKGLKNFPVKQGDKVLYLGAAQGTTASHVSDIVGDKGAVYCVELAVKPFEKLLRLCEERKNMLPLLEDAAQPERYAELVGKVDVVYEDVAQREQALILVRNCDKFLKKGGLAVLMVKARSIDVVAKPSDVFREELRLLEGAGLKLAEMLLLNPFDKDHAALVLRK